MNTVSSVGMIGALLLSDAAQALDWSQDWSDWEVRPRVGTGFMQYKYDLAAQVFLLRDDSSIEGVAQEGLKLEESLLFAELGVSAFLGNFFVDLSFQKSDQGEDDISFDSVNAGVADTTVAFIALDQQGKVEVDRQELSLSFGYAITDFLGVFAGYKKNETSLDQRLAGQVFLARAGEVVEAETVTDVSSDFDQDGFFLGATYIWPYESDGWLNGALSVDVGVAFLDGDFSTSGDRVVSLVGFEGTETVDLGSKASGSAVGLNLGIAWSGPVTGRLSYTVGVDGYQYDYDGEGNSADFEDTLLRFSLGVSYALDAQGIR